MRVARVIAALSLLGLLVSVALPVVSGGHTSIEEALPFVAGFGGLLLVCGLLSLRLSKGALLGATIVLGLAALGSGLVAAANTEMAMRQADSFARTAAIVDERRRNAGKTSYFAAQDAFELRRWQDQLVQDAKYADEADAARDLSFAAAVPAWVGVILAFVRWRAARREPAAAAVAA